MAISHYSWITIKSQPFPPKKLDLLVLSIWIGYRINWIISEVQASNFFFIFLASKKLQAPLRSRIRTCSVFCHSFSVSPGVLSNTLPSTLEYQINMEQILFKFWVLYYITVQKKMWCRIYFFPHIYYLDAYLVYTFIQYLFAFCVTESKVC